MLWRSRSSTPRQYPPGFIAPCLATNGQAVPTGPQWAYEIKHDGFRFICRRDGDRVRVYSRNRPDWTDRVPLIAEAMTKLRMKSVTIDGEGVVCRADGVSDFDRLRCGRAAGFARCFSVRLRLAGNGWRGFAPLRVACSAGDAAVAGQARRSGHQAVRSS